MLEAALSILSGAMEIHSWINGIKHGKIQEAMLDELKAANVSLERISEGIFYAASIQEIRSLEAGAPARILADKRDVRQLLEPLQSRLDADIISTALVSTTTKLREAFRKDPWEVLFNVRPLTRVKASPNPDAAPIIFSDEGSFYVGWQMKGAMPSLFNCEYDEVTGLFRVTGSKVLGAGRAVRYEPEDPPGYKGMPGESDRERKYYQSAAVKTMACPHCGVTVLRLAVTCRSCGSGL